MKLISFAAISLLAITVSAYPPPSTSTENMQTSQSTATHSTQQPQSTSTHSTQQPQSTSTQAPQQPQSTFTQDMQQSDQHIVQGELEKLEEAYKELEGQISEIYNSIKMLKKKESRLRSEMKRLVNALNKAGDIISGKIELWNEYNISLEGWKKAYTDVEAKQEELKKVKEERDGVKAELDALGEMQ